MSLLALAAVAARAQSGDCSDPFDGTEPGPAWTFVDADGSAGGSAAVAGGKLTLTGRGRDVFNTVNEFVAVRRADLPGDFDVSVKIESQTNTHEWAQAGIIAANDVSDLSKGGYVAADVTPSNGFHLFWDAAGTVGTLDAHADVGKSAYPVWIRLARTGTRFSAWYRTSSGAAWTPISQNASTQDASGPSQVALFSLSHNASQNASTVFDDFTCTGAATSLARPRGGPRAGYRTGYGTGDGNGSGTAADAGYGPGREAGEYRWPGVRFPWSGALRGADGRAVLAIPVR